MAGADRDQPAQLSNHWVDRHEWPNQFSYDRNVFAFEATAAPSSSGRFEFASPQKLPVFPNPGLRIVGTHTTRISPRIDR
jgi:hypothetical protein